MTSILSSLPIAILSPAGFLVGAVLLVIFLPLLWMAPAVAYGQRCGVFIGLCQAVRMGFRRRPMRLLVDTCHKLACEGLACPISVAEEVYVATGGAFDDPSSLGQRVKDAFERGEVPVFATSSSDFANRIQLDPRTYRDLRGHLGRLVGATCGVAVLLFFFHLSSGPVYVDEWFLAHDWVEVPGMVVETRSGYRSQPTTHQFVFEADGRQHRGWCYGPRVNEGDQVTIRYDTRDVTNAVIRGGSHARHMPVWSAACAGLLAMMVVPFALCIVHIAYGLFGPRVPSTTGTSSLG